MISTPDGGEALSSFCSINRTVVTYRVTVNATAVVLTNDVGCDAVALGTPIGSRKADAYLVTDDDFGYWTLFDAVRFHTHDGRDFDETFDGPMSVVARRWWWPPTLHGRIGVLEGLLRVRRTPGFEARLELRPTGGAAVPDAFDLRMSVLPLLSTYGYPDTYAFVLCEAGGLPDGFFGSAAPTSDLVRCAEAPFDPDHYKRDTDHQIFAATTVAADDACGETPLLASLLISVDATYMYKQVERCETSFGGKLSRTSGVRQPHGLKPPFVAGIEVRVGKYAGRGGFGGNVERVTWWKRDRSGRLVSLGGGDSDSGGGGGGGGGGPSGLAVFTFLLVLSASLAMGAHLLAKRGMLPGPLGERFNYPIDGRARARQRAGTRAIPIDAILEYRHDASSVDRADPTHDSIDDGHRLRAREAIGNMSDVNDARRRTARGLESVCWDSSHIS